MILWNVTNKTKTAERDRIPNSIGFSVPIFNKKRELAGWLASIMYGPEEKKTLR